MNTRTWVCLHCKTCGVFETGEPVKICPNCKESEIATYDGSHCGLCPVWRTCLFPNQPLSTDELLQACRKIICIREEKSQHE